jgi:hypothetical protein
MQSTQTVQVDPVANLRRAVIISVGLGVASVVIAAILGHVLAGVFGCLGLGLGAFNNMLLQRAVINHALLEGHTNAQFRHGVFARLGLITLLAIGIAFLVRPDGLGVFVGLAAFQILMLLGASIPVLRSLRASS